jgi:hypothetical protein
VQGRIWTLVNARCTEKHHPRSLSSRRLDRKGDDCQLLIGNTGVLVAAHMLVVAMWGCMMATAALTAHGVNPGRQCGGSAKQMRLTCNHRNQCGCLRGRTNSRILSRVHARCAAGCLRGRRRRNSEDSEEKGTLETGAPLHVKADP